uniref:C2H2-type domain-containing protein n=1 Tax=Plectus sambesii TaxID=2011161 RepID=A0A914VXD6_9BILA
MDHHQPYDVDAVSLEEQTLRDLEEELEDEILKVIGNQATHSYSLKLQQQRRREKTSIEEEEEEDTVLLPLSVRAFNCQQCGNRYVTRELLLRHVASKHQPPVALIVPGDGDETLLRPPQIQPKPFDDIPCTSELLAEDIQEEGEEGHSDDLWSDLSCPFCTYVGANKPAIDEHLVQEHGLKDGCFFKCATCERVFKSRPLLCRHSRIHTDMRPFACSVCHKTFPWPEHLHAHMNTHKARKYNCKECQAEFSSSSALRRHERTHQETFRYVCNVCGEGFHVSEPYKIHRRKHAELKPFACGVCGQRYYSRSACRRHTIAHTDERRFECGECGSKFRDRQTADRHQLVHTRERPFRCSVCDLGLATKHNLKMHMRKIHPERSDLLEAPQTISAPSPTQLVSAQETISEPS